MHNSSYYQNITTIDRKSSYPVEGNEKGEMSLFKETETLWEAIPPIDLVVGVYQIFFPSHGLFIHCQVFQLSR